MGDATDVEVAALGGVLGGGEVGAEHGGEGDAFLDACGGVADHGSDDIVGVEGLDNADGGCFFAGCEPCFGDDALFDPAFEGDVVEAGLHQTRVEGF